MIVEQQHAILTIDDHKLCIAIQPNFEKDRGFIRFFDSSQITAWNDDNVLSATESHGNGLIMETACQLIQSIKENAFVEISDKSVITKAEGLSWYNAFTVDSSLCVFRYIDAIDGNTKRAMTVLKDFDGCKDLDSFIAESIKNHSVLAFPEGQNIYI
ncbi:hypothetical protein LMH73_021390 [Vibrio splendidus]|nr:hypothetical protein [Vibrio splendidus]MCC4880550.1 hypothetical protein [Vibrio splendidus]